MINCITCKNNFEIPEEDLTFLDKVSPVINGEKFKVPTPGECPACRQTRRLAFRNENSLYKRKCDATGKEIISMYSPDKPFRIYDQEEWWSDRWDPFDYGQDYDFSKNFFDQFRELQLNVPRMSLVNIAPENSYYTSYTYKNKDCYLIYTADYNEKCLYGRMAISNYDCMDFDITDNSNHCYECIDTYKSHSSFFSQKIENCHECIFTYNLKNCKNCIFCVNLTNKDHHIFNKPVSKEEFEKVKSEIFDSRKIIELSKKKFEEIKLKYPRKYLENLNCEDCIGNYLKDCKNAKQCFDSRDLEDCKYCSSIMECKDCYDWDFVGGKSELCYQVSSSAYHLSNCLFLSNCWDGANEVMYSDLMVGTANCFGCIGLRKKQYCILNKQYSKEEYFTLLPKIIKHMQKTGEWGQYFPSIMSPYGYNETIAQLYYPLEKGGALAAGFNWMDEKDYDYSSLDTAEPPQRITETEETICKKIIRCDQTQKPFKVIPQEYSFYKKNNIPVPTKSPLARQINRMALRTPRQVFRRECAKCNSQINTCYSPDRPEVVFCEECYLAEVY